MWSVLLLAGVVSAQQPDGALKPPLPAGEQPGMSGGKQPVQGGGMQGGGMQGGGVQGGKQPMQGGKQPMQGGKQPMQGGAGEGGSRESDVRRVIARVSAKGASTVELSLTGPEGPAVSVPLEDKGSAPDLKADDDEFSGQGMLPGDTVSVSVVIDGRSMDAGSVAWEATAGLRLLTATVEGDVATAKASVGEKKEKTATQGGKPSGVGGKTPGAGGLATTPAAPTWGGLALPLAVLVGLVALGVIIGLLPRKGAVSGPVLPGLTRVPPAGFLGPGTPSVGDGARLWGVAAEDRTRFLGVMLDALARYHPVVVALPDGEVVPSPVGGVVFRSAAAPKVVLESARALAMPGRLTVILVVPLVGERSGGWPESTPGFEVLVLCAPLHPDVDVGVARDGPGWRVRSPQGEVRLG